MRLEFHQLDRRLENLRVRHPARQRRLIASLAEAGQQTPIIVIQTGGRYLVIDGHKRIAALQQLGRDTVEARGLGDERSRSAGAGTIAAHERAGSGARTRLAAGRDGMPSGMLDRRTRAALRPQQDMGGEPPGIGGDAAGIGAAAGARRQDRCAHRHAVSGTGGAHQPGALPAHGRHFRRTVRGPRGKPARSITLGATPAATRARTHSGSAEAVSRNHKTQRATTLDKELNQITAPSRSGRWIIWKRQRRTAPPPQRKIQRAIELLTELQQRIEEPETNHAEPIATSHDSGTASAGSGETRDRAAAESLAPKRPPGAAGELERRAEDRAGGESDAVPPADPRVAAGSAKAISCESMRNWRPAGAAFSYQALTAFCRREGIGQDARRAGRPLRVRAGRGNAA